MAAAVGPRSPARPDRRSAPGVSRAAASRAPRLRGWAGGDQRAGARPRPGVEAVGQLPAPKARLTRSTDSIIEPRKSHRWELWHAWRMASRPPDCSPRSAVRPGWCRRRPRCGLLLRPVRAATLAWPARALRCCQDSPMSWSMPLAYQHRHARAADCSRGSRIGDRGPTIGRGSRGFGTSIIRLASAAVGRWPVLFDRDRTIPGGRDRPPYPPSGVC
jgi:hypothetical protein